jgi:shikimate dehydrogenase
MSGANTTLSGHTQPFAVLGHPIGHTLSPVMHNASFRALELDAVYLAFDVRPDRLMRVLPAMRDMGFGGVNLTVPLKEVAFRGLDRLDATAAAFGAVNTVAFAADGTIRGHNTDGTGFVKAVEESLSTDLSRASVFVIGTGGAGRAVAITCALQGCPRLALTDQDPARPANVAAEIERLDAATSVRSVPFDERAWIAAAAEASLVVQATPVGMRPEDPALLPPEAFREGQRAFDLVYMYPQTPFMRSAQRGGARAANGLGMLLHQGAEAFRIWTGRPAATDVMRAALEACVYGSAAP